MQFAVPALLVVHVFAAVFWYGSAMFLIRFVLPTASAEGESGGLFLARMAERTRFPYALVGAGALVILTGLALLDLVSGGFSPAFMSTHTGIALSFGGACALVAFLLAILFARGLRSRAISAALILFLGLALLAMVLSNYV
jgi:uncharacterized membrane protein